MAKAEDVAASTRQLRDELIALKDILDRFGSLIEHFDGFIDVLDDVDDQLSYVVLSLPPDKRLPHAKRAQSRVEEASRIARSWDIENIIVGLRNFIAELVPIYQDTQIGKALAVDAFVEDARAVLDAYKRFREAFSNAETYRLLREAEPLSLRYRGLHQTTESLLSDIGSPGRVATDQAVLELRLPISAEIGRVRETLASLENLYDLVATLVAEDGPPTPIEIRRLEAGTMWYLMVGGRLVVAVLRELFRTTLQAFTRRGRAETLDAELVAALHMGEYAALVEGTGGDAEPLIQRIHAAAPALGARFSALFATLDGRVAIDGEQFELAEGRTRQLPRPPRALPPAREYRRSHRGTVWHFCPRCSNWPAGDYEIAHEIPAGDRVDQECLSKERRGICT